MLHPREGKARMFEYLYRDGCKSMPELIEIHWKGHAWSGLKFYCVQTLPDACTRPYIERNNPPEGAKREHERNGSELGARATGSQMPPTRMPLYL